MSVAIPIYVPFMYVDTPNILKIIRIEDLAGVDIASNYVVQSSGRVCPCFI